MNTVRNKRLKLSSPSLSEALERYLTEVSVKKKGGYTDASLVGIWRGTSLSSRTISSIKPSDLIRYRNEWLNSFAAATVVRRFSLISHLFTIAIKEWGMTYLDDPTKLIQRPKVENARIRRIRDNIGLVIKDERKDEIDWIVSNTRSKTLPIIITVALETAMRRSEILGIRREHLDFGNGVLFIPDSKSGKSRSVPLSPWMKYSLIEYLIENNNRGLIFNTSVGAVTRAFIRAVRKARTAYETKCEDIGHTPEQGVLENLRFHDLRHEATSRLAEVYEMHELAKITGHADTRMLLRYFHPDINMLTMKLANSVVGQRQFNKINEALLKKLY